MLLNQRGVGKLGLCPRKSSFPRKRESRTALPKTGVPPIRHFGIPAYAGMTVGRRQDSSLRGNDGREAVGFPLTREGRFEMRGIPAYAGRTVSIGDGSGSSYKVCFKRRARERVRPGTAAISSTGASLMAWMEPNFRSSIRLRLGPMPVTRSMEERRLLLLRRWRW